MKQKNAVEPVINLALDLNYQKRLPGIYAAMGIYYIWVEEDFSKGKQYLKDVFEIAAKVGDYFTLYGLQIINWVILLVLITNLMKVLLILKTVLI